MPLEPGMTAKTRILLQHGWGYDSNLWNDWVSAYSELDFITPDRGYFWNIKKTGTEHVEVAVTHSLGLHFLPEKLFQSLKVLVIIAGFQEFHPNTPIERTFSKRIVKHMLRNIKSDADTILKKFYRNSYYPEANKTMVRNDADAELLYKDLELLDRHKIDIELLRSPGKVIILHGMKDAIVPHNKAYQLQYSLPGSEIHTIDDGNHMIPVTHRESCFKPLKDFLI